MGEKQLKMTVIQEQARGMGCGGTGDGLQDSNIVSPAASLHLIMEAPPLSSDIPVQ